MVENNLENYKEKRHEMYMKKLNSEIQEVTKK